MSQNVSSNKNEVFTMQNVYEYCPQFENDKFLLRFISFHVHCSLDISDLARGRLAVIFFSASIIILLS